MTRRARRLLQCQLVVRQDVRSARRDRGAAAVGPALRDRDPVRRCGRGPARGRSQRPPGTEGPAEERRRSTCTRARRHALTRSSPIGRAAPRRNVRSRTPRPVTGSSPQTSGATPPRTSIVAAATSVDRGQRRPGPDRRRGVLPSAARRAAGDAARRLGVLHRLAGRPRSGPRQRRDHDRGAARRDRAAGRPRSRTALAVASPAHQLLRGGQLQPVASASTMPAARCSSTNGSGASAAITRSSSSSSRGGTRRRHRVRGRHRPVPRPAGQPPSTSATRSPRISTTSTTGTRRRGTTSSSSCVGPAVDDVAFTFAERWQDPAPLDSPTPWRLMLHRGLGAPQRSRGPSPRTGSTASRPAATRCRSCARTRVDDRAIRSRPMASAASHGRTRRRFAAPGASSTSRISTCGHCEATRRARATHCDESRDLQVVDRAPALPRSRRRGRRTGQQLRPRARPSTGSATPEATASPCTTSRTQTASRSTCTPRCASSTTSGWPSAPTTSTAVRGRTTRSCRAR